MDIIKKVIRYVITKNTEEEGKYCINVPNKINTTTFVRDINLDLEHPSKADIRLAVEPIIKEHININYPGAEPKIIIRIH